MKRRLTVQERDAEFNARLVYYRTRTNLELSVDIGHLYERSGEDRKALLVEASYRLAWQDAYEAHA